jgi:hypothetical protein
MRERAPTGSFPRLFFVTCYRPNPQSAALQPTTDGLESGRDFIPRGKFSETKKFTLFRVCLRDGFPKFRRIREQRPALTETQPIGWEMTCREMLPADSVGVQFDGLKFFRFKPFPNFRLLEQAKQIVVVPGVFPEWLTISKRFLNVVVNGEQFFHERAPEMQQRHFKW